MTPPEKPVDPKRSKLAAEIAVRLRELRARVDLTQEEVARRAGCHESAISRWESAARLPSCSDLIGLSQVYQVSIDYLLGQTIVPVPSGTALLDQSLLDRLQNAETTQDFDDIVQERRGHAVWVTVEPGAILVSVTEAVRRASDAAASHPESRHAERLFRPR